MIRTLKNGIRSVVLSVLDLGFDPRRFLSLRFYPRYRRDKREWVKQGGTINSRRMILSDYAEPAGNIRGHYFHQDLLVARFIFEHGPRRHVDVGSRIDGFVAHVAAFRDVEVVDIRPTGPCAHASLKFTQLDITNAYDLGLTDSLSCLHALEHFGLGRYSDPVDVNGHLKGITHLLSLISPNGRLYLSVPIGAQDEVHFNAHRIFNVKSLLRHPEIHAHTNLIRFDYVDDEGALHLNADIDAIGSDLKYGCGIYTFEKRVETADS